MKFQSIRAKLLLTFFSIFIVLLICFAYFIITLNDNRKEIENLNALYAAPSGDPHRGDTTETNAVATIAQISNKPVTIDGRQSNQNQIIATLSSISIRNTKLYQGIILSSVVLTLLFGAGAFWIILTLTRSLKNPVVILNNLVQGDTGVHFAPAQDEFDDIVQAANQLSANLRNSSTFAQRIGEGNFNFDFSPASEQDVLGNSLVQMREKLKSIAEADKKRNWVSEGLAMFADLIRKGENQKALFDTLISELVKYTKSNQGGLFIVNRDNESDLYLELRACYAYDRKKHMEKRVEIGTGLLGQCYLEGEPVYLTQVPKDYVFITSGLGTATPSSVLIVPLKVNEQIEGVIELASFSKFDSHEIEFVQKVGEVMASAIVNFRITEQTKKMLHESQQQSEQMRAQEEEMRQNMEEMQATQETMERQTAELKKMQVSLEMEKGMFHVLMDFLPDRITYKDTESRIIRVNKAKAQRMNMTVDEFLGKTDYDFFNKDHAEKAHREEKAMIETGKPNLNIEERIIFTNTNEVGWVSTSRIPFRNEQNKVIGMLIITKDTTKLKIAEFSLQDRERVLQQLLKELPVFHYRINKDKIIYEAWSASKSGLPAVSDLKSKSVKDLFPGVYGLVQNGTEVKEDKTSTETFAATQSTFKHYIFNDSVHPGFYLVYALKTEN